MIKIKIILINLELLHIKILEEEEEINKKEMILIKLEAVKKEDTMKSRFIKKMNSKKIRIQTKKMK
jgi:2-methylaconitate cis-trans-isomerase PrpF